MFSATSFLFLDCSVGVAGTVTSPIRFSDRPFGVGGTVGDEGAFLLSSSVFVVGDEEDDVVLLQIMRTCLGGTRDGGSAEGERDDLAEEERTLPEGEMIFGLRRDDDEGDRELFCFLNASEIVLAEMLTREEGVEVVGGRETAASGCSSRHRSSSS